MMRTLSWDTIASPYRWSGQPLLCRRTPDGDAARRTVRVAVLDRLRAAGPAGDADELLRIERRERAHAWDLFARRLSNCDNYRAMVEVVTGGHGEGIVWWPVVLGVAALRRAAGRSRTARLSRALASGRCPACGYHVGSTGALRLSAACQECGEPWPLFPPPAAHLRSCLR